MTAPAELTQVLDPEKALEISRRGVAEQRREERAFRVLVQQIETLRVEDHLADRLENLLGRRR